MTHASSNKPMGKKMLIFVGSVLLVVMVVFGVAMVWFFTNKDSLPEATYLRVTTNPYGASVSVANVPKGKAPVNVSLRESMLIKEGEDYVLRVAVSKEGYLPETVYASLGPDALDQNGKLVPGKTYEVYVIL